MKFQCRYCKIVFECSTFEECRAIQDEQCFVTLRGITHSLKGLMN